MATSRFTDQDSRLDELYGDVAAADLQPLWKLSGLLTPEPVPRTVPYRWRAEALRGLAARSGELVGIDRGGDRRVLACANPGLGGAPYATSTMWAGMQYLGAGERAPAHRHTPAALRFVLAGEGAWTLVDGDPLRMATGDLVLTPSMTFHEHHNPGAEPMMWLDVLDLPVVAALDAVFFEEGADARDGLSSDPASAAERLWGAGPGLVPGGLGKARHEAAHSPLLVYRRADTDRALAAQLAATGASEAQIRYTNPQTGADVMPTMRCEMRRVRGGSRSRTTRQAGSRVGAVLAGTGEVLIGDQRFELAPGDVFAVPSWAPYGLAAEENLDVFSVSDAPVLEALGLYREREC
ncbi:cupin domain-containing protein [Amycolatopsis sp. CA-161197]|uniref:cupin domain-containing protein n=1 Tax=Amycolatopsis sp. CA-161197 TaxID=3239922 RepID=UPI003D8FFD19